jgi:PAS domain-containing protein
MLFDLATEWPQSSRWSQLLQALGEPERLLAAFFTASNVGLAVVDTRLNYLALNDSLAEMNGLLRPI